MILKMLSCPVCKVGGINSEKELRSHITGHKVNGDAFAYPMQCAQFNCDRVYSNIDSFINHVKNCHVHVRPTNNRDTVYDFPLLFNTADEADENVYYDDNSDDEDVSDFQDRHVELKNYEEKVFSLLLLFFSNSSIPQSFIGDVLQSFADYVGFLSNNLGLLLKNANVPDEGDMVAILNEVDRALNAVKNVGSVFKAKDSLCKHPLFVKPESVVLGYRNDANLRNGNDIENRQTKEESFYIPILKTLESVLSDPDVANLIIDEIDEAVPVGTYNNPKHGSKYLSHPLFSDKSKVSLRIQVSYDGMGTTNPLRGHSSIHNVGIFYFTIQNLPPHFNTCFPNVHLFSVCYSGDLKKYGFRPVLERFMKDINILETSGIQINVAGRGQVNFFGSLSQFSGDCLAINEIFGLVCDFSHDYHCSMCYCSKISMSSFFTEDKFELRSRNSHALDVREQTLSGQIHVRGVKAESVLNESLYFHTAENMMVDLLHIFPEGIQPYEIGSVLYVYICVKKLFTIDQFNDRVRWLFSIAEVDKGNTPAELNPIKEAGKGISPKLTGNEMMALSRLICLILSEFVSEEEEDEYWEFLLQLQTLTEIAFSSTLNKSVLNYFSELYADHLQLFKKLFPTLPIKPKQHYLIHFKSMVEINGPPTYSSCFKYELRNSSFKRAAHIVCNFKNIPKTLTFRNQLSSLGHTISKSRMRNFCVATHKLQANTIGSIPDSAVISLKLSLGVSSVVFTTTKVRVWGRKYSVGNYLILNKCPIEGELQFGIIQKIIWLEETKSAFFYVKKMRTLGFKSFVNAYIVEQTDDSDGLNFSCVSVDDLLDYHPLDMYIPTIGAPMHLKLRYFVMG